eukprot:g1872.t1
MMTLSQQFICRKGCTLDYRLEEGWKWRTPNRVIRLSLSTRTLHQRISLRCFAVSQKPKKSELEGTVLVNSAEARDEEQDESIPEAVVTTGQKEKTEEVQSRTFMTEWIQNERVLITAKNGFLVFAGITFLIAVFNTLRKFLSPKARRKRTVNKNRELIEDLVQYLPDRRAELTEKAAWMIRVKAGFTPTEVFRKYLWYLLRERKFDQTAVDDLICLKKSLQLTEEDVATALKERAQRIYEKYGTLMLNTAGMTSAGVERKATCQALFSKILYLTEHEAMLTPESEAAKIVDLKEIFGATDEDESKLRIVSLEEVDLDKLAEMLKTSEEGVQDPED